MYRGGGSPAQGQPADLFVVRSPGAGLRHAGRAAIRIRAALGNRGVFPVRDAPGRVSALWREGRVCSVGRRQTFHDHDPYVTLKVNV